MQHKKIFLRIIALGLSALVLWGVTSWTLAFRLVRTDNAFVQTDITSIAPKVAGYITELPVNDNSPVKAGDLLFVIDPRDYMAKAEQAAANVRAAESTVANGEAGILLQHSVIGQAEAQLAIAEAVQKRATQELARQSSLRREKATTEQNFEDSIRDKAQADAALSGAKASLEVQIKQLDVLAAQLSSARAGLDQAKASLSLARLDLEHCRVSAPVDGVIGNRKARVGRYVTPGTTLLDLVPLEDVWIVANFKETQLESLSKGQRVTIIADGYPQTPLTGTVESFAPGSGAAFSLIPPDNATGNFIRVVQRVPVKITLDDNPLKGVLVPGLSVQVTVSPDQ
jgi:Multidrug resistance efflux pump